jgi:hypothetical protein
VWSDSREDSPAEARYPSGKGEVCKTFMRRFDPDPRLQTFLVSPIFQMSSAGMAFRPDSCQMGQNRPELSAKGDKIQFTFQVP